MSALAVLFPSLAAGIVLVAGKALLLGAKEENMSYASWWGQVMAVSWQDVTFTLLYAGAGASGLWLTRRHPRGQLAWWRLWLLAGAAAIAYHVIHVAFYETFRRAINVQSLRFAGNIRNLRSSVLARVTWPYALSLTAFPTALVVLGWRRRPAPSRRLCAAVCLLSAVWMAAGRHLQRTSGHDWIDRMGQNPHSALAFSWALDFHGRRSVAMPGDLSPDELVEFQTFAERSPSVQAGPPAAPIRNVVVLVLESTGARYLSLYGSHYRTTPHLDAEAPHSLVLENAYANIGHTVCSFMVLNFSLYPGLPWCYLPCGERPLPPTLAGVLGKRGHRTALLSSADMNYEGMAWAAERHGYQSVRHYWDLGCENLSSWGAADQCLFDGILDFIDEKPKVPFYVMAWTNQAHDPYVMTKGEPVVDFLGGDTQKTDLGRYLNILRTVDAGIQSVLDGLRQRGLAEETLVVITGDHGEAFREPHDYSGHGGVLYDESVRVPLVFWNPKVFAGGARSPRVAAHVDINPTVAELLGIPAPGGWQGRSLLDATRPDRAYFLAGLGEFQFGVREGAHKYVYNATFGSERLFDLVQDADEQRDVSAQHPEVCRRLRRRLAAWIEYEEQFLAGESSPHR